MSTIPSIGIVKILLLTLCRHVGWEIWRSTLAHLRVCIIIIFIKNRTFFYIFYAARFLDDARQNGFNAQFRYKINDSWKVFHSHGELDEYVNDLRKRHRELGIVNQLVLLFLLYDIRQDY